MTIRIHIAAALSLMTGLCAASDALATTVFGLKSCGSANPPVCGAGVVGNSLPPTSLYSFQADNAFATFNNVGSVQRGGSDLDVDGLAIAGNELFAFELTKSGFVTTASTLVTIDAGTATASIVQTTLIARDIRGAVFDAQGTLLAIDAAANELLSINTMTGTVIGSAIALTLNGNPYDLGDDSDIAFNASGTMYLGDSFDLFTLDRNAGALTNIFTESNPGTDGSIPVFTGLAFTDGLPVDALIAYDVAFDEDVFRYDIDTGFARTQLLSNILPLVNAGRGDLAANVAVVPIPAGVLLLIVPLYRLVRMCRKGASGD